MPVETLLIGLVLALLWAEITDISPGGLIVPGYFALYLGQPLRVAVTLAAALATLAVYRLLVSRLILFGRRRFVLLVLVGAVLTQVWILFLPRAFAAPAGLNVIGLIIPGILASSLARQKVLPTLASLLAVSTLTFAAAGLCGAPVSERKAARRVFAAAVLSAAYLVLLNVLPSAMPAPEVRTAMTAASVLMARSEAAVRACREARGIPIDAAADPNGTGLIGVERSIVTTSLGSLEAKRTTANPAFAALVVSLLHEAGAGRGDVIAVGASSSFPALIVATLAAAEAAGVEPLVISSLGASEWGANIPEFGWLEMEECLRQGGIFAMHLLRVLRFSPSVFHLVSE